jgi:hypothetical protein
MANQRRGGSRSPELRGSLAALLRTTVAQAGVVRDALATGARAALERGTRDIRTRSDARGERRRDEALAALGAAVLELIRAGEIDLEELPEVRDVVDELDLIDRDEPRPRRTRLRQRHNAGFDDDGDDEELDRFAKFDRGLIDRGQPRDGDAAAMPWSRDRFDDRDRPRRDSDGTVSATSTVSAAPRRVSTATQVWRPVAQATVAAPHAEEHKPRGSGSEGGIAFDDDDLDEYMHPDDVPKAKPPDDPPSDS